MTKEIVIFDESQGEFIGVAGDNYRTIVAGEQTNGAFSVFDMQIPPGGGPTPHAHPKIQELFYVLEGELVYKTEKGSATVKKHGSVLIPNGGAVHCFKNESDKMARVLCIVLPAGLEDFFRATGEPVKAGEFPPIKTLTAETQAKWETIAKSLEFELYPPDYLD